MVKLVVNDHEYLSDVNKSILEVLNTIGVSIPALCYDKRIPPASTCRLCLVKVDKSTNLLPACSTLITEGMKIDTHLPEIEEYRKDILRMLSKDYPLSAVGSYPEKEFHKLLTTYQLAKELNNDKPVTIDRSHPYINVDMSRCISCFRCVRICDKVQGQFVWHIINRGADIKIISDSKSSFSNSSCVSCGACAETCPSGAIDDRVISHGGAKLNKVRSICAYCGVGCEIEVGVMNNAITEIHPVIDSPVSKGHLCVKGRYAWQYATSKDRVTHPMIRENDRWNIVSWEEALRYCAKRFKDTIDQYGPDSIGVLGSARATNEDNYVIQKFARTVIGTNNVDCCARVCHQPTAKAMSMMLGTGAATNSFDDIEKARTFLLAGTNACENHPVIGARIKQMGLKGANLIVIDPRKTEFTRYAKVHLALKPGTNIPLLNAMAQVIIEEELYDRQFVETRIDGWEEYKKTIIEWTPEKAAKICRVHPRLIREASRLYAGETPSMTFHGLGITEHTQGTEGVIALVNLALLTGNICKTGTGVNPLRGQNNVQGSSAMGCDPDVYAGFAHVKKEKVRFEELWQTSLPNNQGFTLPEMLEAATKGKLKGMWIIGYDVSLTMSDGNSTTKAFDNLDFLIVQDMFLNETAEKFADVFLPVASSFEKEGTFMNAERRIQKIRTAVSPPDEVLADWQIICTMAEVMGKKNLFTFSSPEGIWNEIRKVWPSVNGITYERLDHAGLQWPCLDTHDPGTEILHQETFSLGKKARLMPLTFVPTPEQVSFDYPFILITGRELYHFNAGTMTYRTRNKDLSPSDFLRIHPHDADRLELKDGDYVKVTSAYGAAQLCAKTDRAMRRGEVFTTFSNKDVFINKVTSPHKDNYVQTPEYKVTAVRIEKTSS